MVVWHGGQVLLLQWCALSTTLGFREAHKACTDASLTNQGWAKTHHWAYGVRTEAPVFLEAMPRSWPFNGVVQGSMDGWPQASCMQMSSGPLEPSVQWPKASQTCRSAVCSGWKKFRLRNRKKEERNF